MDERVTYRQQLEDDTGPIVLINQFTVAPTTPNGCWRHGPKAPPT
jgi:hypothetical protein